MGLAQWIIEIHGFSIEKNMFFFHGLPWVCFNGTKIDDLEVNFQSLKVPSSNITAKAYTFCYLYIQCSVHLGKKIYTIFMLFQKIIL